MYYNRHETNIFNYDLNVIQGTDSIKKVCTLCCNDCILFETFSTEHSGKFI